MALCSGSTYRLLRAPRTHSAERCREACKPCPKFVVFKCRSVSTVGKESSEQGKNPQQSSNTNLVSMAFLETWAFSFFFPFLLILKMFWIVDFPGESKWQSRKKFEGAEGRRRKCQTKASWNEKGETPWSQSRAEQLAAVSLACVTRSGWCNPSQHRVQNWMIFKVSSQPSHSVILNTGGKLCLYSWLL